MFRKLFLVFALLFCFLGIIHASDNDTFQKDYNETTIQNGNVANENGGILGTLNTWGNKLGKVLDNTAHVIGATGAGVRRLLVGGKPIDEKKLMGFAEYAFRNFFSYMESDINQIAEEGAKAIGKVAGIAGTVFGMIMSIYILFLGIRYLFFAQLDISIYDLLMRNIKWAIIICLFFLVPMITSLYGYVVNIDQVLTHAFFGKEFGSTLMDTLAIRSFKVIIPIYNQYASAGLLTSPVALFGSMRLLYAFGMVVIFFLTSAFASYMTFKLLFAVVLIFLPVAAGCLLFDETKGYFASYVTGLGQLLIIMMCVIFLTDMFCSIFSHLLDVYYNKNILMEGMENLSPDLKKSAEVVSDLATTFTSGYLEQEVLLMKVTALSGIYVTLMVAVPLTVKNLFKGMLRSKRIG